MEVVASRSVAFFGLLFGAQTFPVMLGQATQLQPSWFWGYNIAIFGGLLLSVLASMIRKLVRAVNLWVAAAYLVAMATWPLAVVDPSIIAQDRPWLWFVCTVATAAAAIGLGTWWAAVYLVAAPSVYGIIRLTPSGGGASWDLAALDTVYAILLGGAVLLIIAMLRGAAASVDRAQSTALSRYSVAVHQHAAEVERVRVDSIVHDSVLSTLISAARAYSPDAMKVSARMATSAMGHLKGAAGPDSDNDALIPIHQLAERVEAAAAVMSLPFNTRVQGIGAGNVLASAAETLYSACMQAMVNSQQHAGGSDSISRWVRITGDGADGVVIEVGDNGNGFDVETVPDERLGVRVSIVERVATAGGHAEVASRLGEGTVVTIRWPDPERHASEVTP